MRAERREDWHGKPVYWIIDDKGHVATMTYSPHSQEFQCSYHRADQWNTQVSVWRKLVNEVHYA